MLNVLLQRIQNCVLFVWNIKVHLVNDKIEISTFIHALCIAFSFVTLPWIPVTCSIDKKCTFKHGTLRVMFVYLFWQSYVHVVIHINVSLLISDTCTIRCLWVAGGVLFGSTCDWLLDPSSEVFSSRERLCKQGHARGCRKTCDVIYKVNDLFIIVSSLIKEQPIRAYGTPFYLLPCRRDHFICRTHDM